MQKHSLAYLVKLSLSKKQFHSVYDTMSLSHHELNILVHEVINLLYYEL